MRPAKRNFPHVRTRRKSPATPRRGVCRRGNAHSRGLVERVGQILRARLGEQPADLAFRLGVFPFAEMMPADLPLGVHEIVRRPELVVEGFPDRHVVVECDGILDVELLDRRAHVLDVLFERELRRMHAEHDETRVLVVAIPGIHVRHRAQAVDARVRPEIDDHDLAAQALGREWLAVEPAGGPVSGGSGPSVFDGPLAPCADIIAPPSAGFSAAAIIMAPPTHAARLWSGRGRRLRSRAFRLPHRHRFLDIQRRQHALKVAHFRKIVDDDVGIRRVIDQVVLVIGLGFVESFQRIHARHDPAWIHTRLVELRDIAFRDLLLRIGGVEDSRSILCARVRTLARSTAWGRAPRKRTPAGSGRM